MVYTQAALRSSAGRLDCSPRQGQPGARLTGWQSSLCPGAAGRAEGNHRAGRADAPPAHLMSAGPSGPSLVFPEPLVGSSSVPQLSASTLAPSFPRVSEMEESLLWTAPNSSSSCIRGGPLCLSHLLPLQSCLSLLLKNYRDPLSYCPIFSLNKSHLLK